MKHKRIILLANIFIFARLVAMDIEQGENLFEMLPTDLVLPLITQTHHKYPWQNFQHTQYLGSVCQQWKSAAASAESLCHLLNIPQYHYAAMTNNPQEIINLKLAGHSPLAPDKNLLIPAHYAVACQAHDALTMFKIGSVVHYLAKRKNKSLFKFINLNTDKKSLSILEQLNPVFNYSQDDLTTAIAKENYETVTTILSDDVHAAAIQHYIQAEKVAPNSNLSKLLQFTLQCRLEQMLFLNSKKNVNAREIFFETFTQVNANPNAYDYNGSTLLLQIAAKKGLLPTLQGLLKIKELNINGLHMFKGCNAVQIAASANSLHAMEYLLSKKADGDYITPDGFNIAHYAVHHGNLENLKSVIQRYPHFVNHTDHGGNPPLMGAILKGHIPCMLYLIDKKADLNIKNKHEWAALHYAISKKGNSTEAFELLIHYGANINIAGPNNYTPLHLAAENGKLEFVEILLENNADTTLQTTEGKTALDLAKKNNHPAIIALLS